MLNVLLNLTSARITSLFNNKEATLGLLVLITLCIRLFFLEIATCMNECVYCNVTKPVLSSTCCLFFLFLEEGSQCASQTLDQV